ncbi:uncharacterized protein LOC134462928 [Engraulis encrasicolus]|uniref:uncharacterized protein LOC134462928 n=1 Tax=Engraulis encrasicolus TaxID=184585 RepID=UPI002FD73806
MKEKKMASILWTLLLQLICPSQQLETGCGPLPQLHHIVPKEGKTFPENTRFRYSCEDGFLRQAGTSTFFKCVKNNKTFYWHNEPKLECIRCGPPPEVNHTVFIEGQTFSENTELRYRCEDGFERKSATSNLLKCVKNNKMFYWHNQPKLECIRVIYSTVEGTATLPCGGLAGQNCSSVEWYANPNNNQLHIYNESGSWRLSTRKIWVSQRDERLSLLPDCSLHITNITTEDAGYYRCENPLSGQKKELHLILLDVPSSPSESEAESEDHVTLHCVLHTGVDCNLLTVHPDFNLSWVEVAGTNLWTSTNYQIKKTSACSTTLTVNLTSPTPYSQRRCQVTTGGKVHVSSALHTFGSFVADVYMVVRWVVVLVLLVCAITIEIIRRRLNSK